MKKAIITLAIILFTSTAWAGPFLVCDPYQAEVAVTHFQMKDNGVPVQVPYALHTDGSAIVLDLGPLDNGAHQITDIQACNVRGCSEPPLAFAVPGLPGSPSLRIVP